MYPCVSASSRIVPFWARNDRRERELETLSAIHTTILSENGEQAVVDEITRRVAEVCGDRNAETVAVAAVLRVAVVLLWRDVATDQHCVTPPL